MSAEVERLRRTPLHAWHVAHGAKLVPFGGWEMPVQYPAGILAEHRAVRASAGLFDISHMGRVELRGPDALTLLQRTTTNDLATLRAGGARYSLICHEDGGTLDDIVVCHLPGADAASDGHYLVVVNAGNRERVIAWWEEQIDRHQWQVRLTDRTAALCMVALQGPAAAGLLAPHTDAVLDTMRYYSVKAASVLGHDLLLARTGYTGEDGFELLAPAESALSLWEALLALGASASVVPCGLGARDTLRLEAGFPLYGHELRDDVTPLEAGLDRFVKLDKGPFSGAAALAAQAAAGVPRRLVGFELVERGIPRQGYAVLDADGAPIGEVTSGTLGPSVDRPIGLALVPPSLTPRDSELRVDIRGRATRGRVCALPFVPHRIKRLQRAAGQG